MPSKHNRQSVHVKYVKRIEVKSTVVADAVLATRRDAMSLAVTRAPGKGWSAHRV